MVSIMSGPPMHKVVVTYHARLTRTGERSSACRWELGQIARAFEERNSSMPGFYQPSQNEFDHRTDDFVPLEFAKERKYNHFDLRLREVDRELAVDFSIENKAHRFWPLLGYTDVTRRFVRKKNADGQWIKDSDGNFVRCEKLKKRPIRFASHSDAAYLQAYASYITGYYERALAKDGTSQSVLAYRSGGGTNIHHAKYLFDEILDRGDCSVFAMDISGFFDCLDHKILRDEIAGLLDTKQLDGHHGTVWKNVTRYSWVETTDIEELLGKTRPFNGRICSPTDYVEHVQGRKSGLIRTHELSYGIPQGTPVSGLFANIYLRTFDRQMTAWCAEHGGSYRRYSDDIAVVLPLGAKPHHVVAIFEKMLSDYELAMSVEKTETADFSNGSLVSDRPIQYLGFTFDGHRKLIRASSLDAYRSKMRRGIHAKLVAAKMKNVPSPKVFERELKSRYTHAGKRRNFLRYAYKASEVLNSTEIRQQVKPHTTWFRRAWDKEVVKVYGDLVASA